VVCVEMKRDEGGERGKGKGGRRERESRKMHMVKIDGQAIPKHQGET